MRWNLEIGGLKIFIGGEGRDGYGLSGDGFLFFAHEDVGGGGGEREGDVVEGYLLKVGVCYVAGELLFLEDFNLCEGGEIAVVGVFDGEK